jgi:hypothetical protein
MNGGHWIRVHEDQRQWELYTSRPVLQWRNHYMIMLIYAHKIASPTEALSSPDYLTDTLFGPLQSRFN